MAISRQRALPPELFTDPSLLALPAAVRLTLVGLYMHADDSGREVAHERLLWAHLWPESEEVLEEHMPDHLLLIAETSFVVLYGAAGKTHYQLILWPKVDRPKPSKLPPPPADLLAKASRIIREGTHESFAAGGEREESGEERSEESAGRSRSFRDALGPEPWCPDHPGGTFTPCGPCGTARMQHTRWAILRRLEAENGDPDS